jgi:ribosome-associated toxin RatA of RatAB toxin-antitoxin module
MPTQRLILLLILLWVLPGAPALRAAARSVLLSDLEDEDRFYVQGRFDSAAAPAQVFAVLSDYGHLAGVISGLLKSEILSREGSSLRVQQRLRGQFFIFHRTLELLLGIEEKAPWRIAFQQLGGPFRHYEGAWSLEPLDDTGGTRVDYTLSVSRGDLAPVGLERRLFRDNARSLLEELDTEVSRRAQTQPMLQKTP